LHCFALLYLASRRIAYNASRRLTSPYFAFHYIASHYLSLTHPHHPHHPHQLHLTHHPLTHSLNHQSGTQLCGTNLNIGVCDFTALKAACTEHQIDTLIPGSEEAICNGVRNSFESDPATSHIYVFSPDHHAGQMESSKEFAKVFMQKAGIPTAGIFSLYLLSI
jgi:hypothetical protein